MEIYEKIKETRKARKESQADIAVILQTTQEQIHKYETGKQEIPVRRIITLCKHWNVSSDYLLGLKDEEN